jgi:hypothetical protein
MYLATFQTAEIVATSGAAKKVVKCRLMDASKGHGELETNDIDYAYKYLIMPELVTDIHENVNWLRRKLTEYASCYDPYFTDDD